MNSKIEWNGKMKFKAKSGTGHEIYMDASEENGGENLAARPKEFLLHGIGGCSAMDVISILKKMRQFPETFRIDVSAEQTEEHPMVFKTIHIIYYFSGELDHEKVSRAVELSQTKYCGVSEMLRKTAEITYDIKYE
ncbi:MAG: OsmC family protein [Spirochaetia bacterium]|nr:OsmC family protein [Spirochaetia bacterium]